MEIFAREGGLNEQQQQVVREGDGPCLVLAGAGSGKTRTIIFRVAHLLDQGVSPEQILLVTFTNKAAAEMQFRLQALLGNKIHLPWAGTFHHIAYRLVRMYAPLLGFTRPVSVLDSDDSLTLIKLCSKENKISGDKRFPSPHVLQSLISFSRNAEQPLDEVIAHKFPAAAVHSAAISEIADRYTRKKKEASTVDFDDLLVFANLLLAQETIGKKIATQFKYVLVDEFQDTNKIQASIIKKISSIHHNVLVVGDDAQSIYSFRAADIQNILQFETWYPHTKIFKLETNYRSTPEILALANNSIANNTNQYVKELRAVNKNGERPKVHPQVGQVEEAVFVVKQIQQCLDEGIPPNEIAVLFRAAHHSQRLELELTKAGILYDYRGGVRFFERAHVKDILAYLRILRNPADATAWLRVLLHEEGIGPVAAEKIIQQMKDGVTQEQVHIVTQMLGSTAQKGWQNFLTIWQALTAISSSTPSDCITALTQSAYKDFLETEYIDSGDRLEDLVQLGVFAGTYTDLDQFLAETALQESFGLEAGAANRSEKKDKIILSTIHQAKGLEWSVVFVLNLANGAFPNDRARREENGIEEERRLFYVAITRAKQKLFLTYPLTSGSFGDFLSGPSPFLTEINPELCDDRSLLSTMSSTVFDDPSEDVQYIPEDRPIKIKPGSFLRDLDDL